MRLIGSLDTELDGVIVEGAIEPLPEVAVLHRHHFAKAFPGPAIAAPFFQTVSNAATYVLAWREERDS